MGDEAVEGSKMGTKLIMFVAIVALALVAFLVGKNFQRLILRLLQYFMVGMDLGKVRY